ncbi:MAG: redoxin family protein [Alphaproteobacteria bacterium]|nr:redoxin family protein [Alphaproteobacteria bacterium]
MIARALMVAALGLAFAAGCSPGPAPAEISAPPAPTATAPVRNFTLADQGGASHELYSMTDAKAVVLIMQGVGCPIVRKMTPDLKQVQAAYRDKGVRFLMINSNSQDTQGMIAAEAAEFELDLPVLKDAGQTVGRDLGAVRTAEVFVVDPKTWTIVYHGPLNDRLTYGREKAVADNDYTASVLDAVLAGAPVPVIEEQADGCIINFI